MTGQIDRGALENELTARSHYVEMVRVHGPEYFVMHARPGFYAILYSGRETVRRRRDAITLVEAMAKRCRERISELRARLTAMAMDEERDATTPEERLASARAQRDAIAGPRWRRSA